MTRFLISVVGDSAFWFLIVISVLNNSYSAYAENVLSFVGVFLMVVAIIVLIGFDSVVKSIDKDPKYKPRSKFYKAYVALSSCVEVIVLASLGWYWVAAGFAVYAMVMNYLLSEVDESYAKSH